jgi:hypothetical protein
MAVLRQSGLPLCRGPRFGCMHGYASNGGHTRGFETGPKFWHSRPLYILTGQIADDELAGSRERLSAAARRSADYGRRWNFLATDLDGGSGELVQASRCSCRSVSCGRLSPARWSRPQSSVASTSTERGRSWRKEVSASVWCDLVTRQGLRARALQRRAGCPRPP